MDWSAVGALVAPMAPTIGGLLGGLIPFPGGAILGKVAGQVVPKRWASRRRRRLCMRSDRPAIPPPCTAALTEPPTQR
jgi:hypothetical protein